MFIISKRNFLVRRADGSSFLIKKDFVGDIPQDVFESGLVQGVIKGGLIAAPESKKDKDIYKADEESDKKAAEADIRPDAHTDQEPETTEEVKKSSKKK